MMKIKLASKSPRRKEILKKFKIPFVVVSSEFKENLIKKQIKTLSPCAIANIIALEKAKFALKTIKSGVVLGADTIVVLKNKIIGKPKSKKDAIRILNLLSGNKHKVISAIALVDAQTMKTVNTFDETEVVFKKISKKRIAAYIDENCVLDKAGAYAIQAESDPFVKKINGSYFNVVGLPVEKLKKILNKWETI